MLNKKIFIFLVFILFFINQVSASGITINPSNIPLNGDAKITIDIKEYNHYIYFYKGTSYLTASAIPDCSNTCSGKKIFNIHFSSKFSIGKYKVFVFSLTENKWLETNFTIKTFSTVPAQSETPSARHSTTSSTIGANTKDTSKFFFEDAFLFSDNGRKTFLLFVSAFMLIEVFIFLILRRKNIRLIFKKIYKL